MSLLYLLKLIKRYINIEKLLYRDCNTFISQCASSLKSERNGTRAARDILVYCHVVEKGLSHKQLKPLFGFDRVVQIESSLKDYLLKGGNDPFIIDMAVSTLQEYNKVNSSLGVPNDRLIIIPDIVNKNNDILNVGVDKKSKADFFYGSKSSFSQMCEHRHSMRLYDTKSDPIGVDEIIKGINIAQNCPSACNRQAVRIKIINNPELKNKICDIQGGSKIFGKNADALLIITSDISLYEPSERRIPMLDCGLFIMNLVYAYYEMLIGTCILNGSFTVEREKAMRSVIPIPDNEMYAAVIALSKVPDGEDILVAHSVKRNVEDIIKIF